MIEATTTQPRKNTFWWDTESMSVTRSSCFAQIHSGIEWLTRRKIWKEFPGVGTTAACLNPLLFGLALFVAIGDCPVKQCYSSLTGFAGKAGHIWHSFLQEALSTRLKEHWRESQHGARRYSVTLEDRTPTSCPPVRDQRSILLCLSLHSECSWYRTGASAPPR